jgi:hypothetical protein
MDRFVEFELGRASELEPITTVQPRFRVTMYDPELLRHTHSPGRHRYLIAREIVEADVVINLPKVKMHKKAGVTAALKNVVGINGHKEYLAHHRKGGTDSGGDNYAGHSGLKSLAEELLDVANRRDGVRARRLAGFVASAMVRGQQAWLGGDGNIDGSWWGNDTVWRMAIDLQRILHYGRADATLSDRPERRVVTIADAIVAGEAEGPLAPSPAAVGFITLAGSVAAADLIHCALIGLDPDRIPLVSHAFDPNPWLLASFAPEDVVAVCGGREYDVKSAARLLGAQLRPPSGWLGHCELGRAA